MLNNKYLQIVGGFFALTLGILQGIDWLFKKYEIDNYYFNLILIAIFIVLMVGLIYYFYSLKLKTNNKSYSKSILLKIFLGLFIFVSFLFIANYFYNINKQNSILVNDEIPKIIKLYDEGKVSKVFSSVKKLLTVYPNNEILKNYFNKSSKYVYLKTDKSNIDVSVMYNGDSLYNYLGKTPIDSFLVPNLWNSHNLKLEYNGLLYFKESSDNHDYIFPDENLNIPDNHKVFLGRSFNRMWFQGLEFNKINISPFSMSKYEVSNEQYQKFVDDGGYNNPKYWDFPMNVGGITYDFNSTTKKFVGKYGKSGPANWSYGKHPNGLENHPVTGISWFEARAYANYMELDIPNVFQWLYASGAGVSGIYDAKVLSNSNFNSNQMRNVFDQRGSNEEINNIAGNVKEWLTNPFGENNIEYSILGGSFLEPSYYYKNYSSLPPFDRSIGNGIRLINNLKKKRNESIDKKIIPDFYRDITKEPDVSDDVFDLFKSQFDYKDYPLNTNIVISDSFQEGYTLETFSMVAPYESKEKLYGYIIYSNQYKDKYDPVIIFPSASAIVRKTDEFLTDNLLNNFKYLIDEGYAIIHPIYFNTYSRERIFNSWVPDESEEYKEMIIKMGMDYKRSLDYIETRNDFNFKNLSYYGYSLGSRYANFLLAIDLRAKSAFICSGGLRMQKPKKEVDEHYYLRRVKTPIFHIVGKLDGTLGYEDIFIPWKKLVGTNREDLITLELEGIGHGIPRDTIIKYHQGWIEKYSVN